MRKARSDVLSFVIHPPSYLLLFSLKLAPFSLSSNKSVIEDRYKNYHFFFFFAHRRLIEDLVVNIYRMEICEICLSKNAEYMHFLECKNRIGPIYDYFFAVTDLHLIKER